MTKPVTKAQIAKIHVLLHQLKAKDLKEEMIFNLTAGRTVSTKELTLDEAKKLIEYLASYDPLDRMRKKVFAVAYEAGIIYGSTPDDKKMNGAKLDAFLLSRGTVKKKINQLNYEELVKVISQVEQMSKHIQNANASKVTKQLLNELNIKTV